MIIGFFSVVFVNAQACKGNKVWTCRTCPGLYGTTYQECDCVDADKVVTWLASPCSSPNTNNGGSGGNDYCTRHPEHCGCICAIANKGILTREFYGNEISSAGVYPNPISNSASIYLTLPETEKISLKVFDLSGKLITTVADGSFNAGEHRMDWNASNVNAGIYILRLETENYFENRKLIVTK